MVFSDALKKGRTGIPLLEPTADFFAKEFSTDDNIKAAQVALAAPYENDIRATDNLMRAMNHLEAARIRIANGIDTH